MTAFPSKVRKRKRRRAKRAASMIRQCWIYPPPAVGLYVSACRMPQRTQQNERRKNRCAARLSSGEGGFKLLEYCNAGQEAVQATDSFRLALGTIRSGWWNPRLTNSVVDHCAPRIRSNM